MTQLPIITVKSVKGEKLEKFVTDRNKEQHVMYESDGIPRISPKGCKGLYYECGFCNEAIMQDGHSGRHPDNRCRCAVNK